MASGHKGRMPRLSLFFVKKTRSDGQIGAATGQPIGQPSSISTSCCHLSGFSQMVKQFQQRWNAQLPRFDRWRSLMLCFVLLCFALICFNIFDLVEQSVWKAAKANQQFLFSFRAWMKLKEWNLPYKSVQTQATQFLDASGCRSDLIWPSGDRSCTSRGRAENWLQAVNPCRCSCRSWRFWVQVVATRPRFVLLTWLTCWNCAETGKERHVETVQFCMGLPWALKLRNLRGRATKVR